MSRRSTFVLTGGPCDYLYSARFGHFPSSCPPLCALVFFRCFVFLVHLRIDDLSCNDPFTTRPYVFLLARNIDDPFASTEKREGPSEDERVKGDDLSRRRLLFGPSSLGVSRTRGSSGFINSGRRKVYESVNQFIPQSRPQPPPDSLSASRLLPCRNIRLGIYKLTLEPPNLFSSGLSSSSSSSLSPSLSPSFLFFFFSFYCPSSTHRHDNHQFSVRSSSVIAPVFITSFPPARPHQTICNLQWRPPSSTSPSTTARLQN